MGASLRRSDGVADAARGVNERRCKSRINLFAQARDEDFNGARIVFVIPLPNPFTKFGAGKNPARLLHQGLKHIEFARGKGNICPGSADSAALDVHVQIRDFQEVRRARRRPATADGVDPREEFLHGKRLGEIIICAGFQPFHAILHVAACGENQDPRRAVCTTELVQNRKAVEAGQVEVEDDEIRGILERRRQACVTVVLDGGAMSVPR